MYLETVRQIKAPIETVYYPFTHDECDSIKHGAFANMAKLKYRLDLSKSVMFGNSNDDCCFAMSAGIGQYLSRDLMTNPKLLRKAQLTFG